MPPPGAGRVAEAGEAESTRSLRILLGCALAALASWPAGLASAGESL